MSAGTGWFYGDTLWCRTPPKQGGRLAECRKCDICRRRRQSRWAQRVALEALMAQRTWWCRFSFRPGSLPNGETAYLHFQQYLKRLRAGGAVLRYLCTQEYGDLHGRLHFHALIHCGWSLKKREVQAAWKLGQTQVKLLGDGQSHPFEYVAKYAAKDGRLRASTGYGGKATLAFLKGEGDPKEYGPLVGATFAAFPGARITAVRWPGGRKTAVPHQVRKAFSAEGFHTDPASQAGAEWAATQEAKREAAVALAVAAPQGSPQGELFTGLPWQDSVMPKWQVGEHEAHLARLHDLQGASRDEFRARLSAYDDEARKQQSPWVPDRESGLAWDDEAASGVAGMGVGEGGSRESLYFPDEPEGE